MYRTASRRPTEYRVRRRAPRLALESLETRQLMSASSDTTIITPSVATTASDVQSVGSLAGSVPSSSALTPSQLAAAYGISLSSASGAGQTIAIVDAYNDPNIQADLAAFDNYYHLAPANLTVQNQLGQTTNLPRTDPGWALEIAMDVEWAHAAAPGARIILVEANSASIGDLMTAVQTAARQASVVSMSWGGSEFRGETLFDSSAFFGKPNVTFVAASGDDGGAAGAEWPAVSPNVVGVGGTTLAVTAAGATLGEAAWSASGSPWTGFSGSTGGPSLYEAEPTYQYMSVGVTGRRATPDVASVGNPGTGLSVLDTVSGLGQTGWFQVGGTSAGSPVWAGIIAAADQARGAVGKSALSSSQTLNLLYGLANTPLLYSMEFHDITVGANFVARARTGYDMVTGIGSPKANQLVAAAAVINFTPTASAAATGTATTRVTTGVSPHVAISTPNTDTSATTEIATFAQPDAPAIASPSTSITSAASSTTSPAAATSASAVSLPPTQSARNPFTEFSEASWEDETTSTELFPIEVVPAVERTDGVESESMPPADPNVAPTDSAVMIDAVHNLAPIVVATWWDAAVESVSAESARSTPADAIPSMPPSAAVLGDIDRSLGPAMVAGVAVAAWTVWDYRARRAETEGRPHQSDSKRRSNSRTGRFHGLFSREAFSFREV
jgi:subtilase family serine protease